MLRTTVPFFAPLLFAISFVFSMPSALGVSTLHLRDGGVLAGEVLNPDEINRRTFRVKTAEGLEIILDARLVEGRPVRERDALVEYNQHAPLTANTVENHFHWAIWCIQHQLPDQARVHWQQILELDPEHADARRHLGYTQTQTGWESIEGIQKSRGLTQVGVRWRTAQEIEVEQFLESQRNARQRWNRTIRDLLRRLPNPNAEAELLSIRDPAAAIPIGDILQDRRNPPPPAARMILLRTLMQIPDLAAIQTVAGWSVRPEEDVEIRRRCIEMLQRRINEQPEIRLVVVSVYRTILRHSTDNIVVTNLVADALGSIGGHEAIPELIDSLTITVTETIQPPPQTFGVSPGQSGFSMGERPMKITRHEPMQTVLSALRRLTGADFGFNQDLWRHWYRQHHRSPPLNLRRS